MAEDFIAISKPIIIECRIGEGNCVVSTGWSSFNATHSGDNWIGTKATGKRFTQRIMDFWRREDDLFVENWEFIDMVDLIGQLGTNCYPLTKREMP